MSIAEFKGALKDKAYTEWFKKSAKSIFIQTSEQLRPSEQSKQKTSLLITEKDIIDMGMKLAGRSLNTTELSKIKTDLIEATKRRNVVVRKDGSLFYPVVNFKDGITNILAKGFASIQKVTITEKDGSTREARVSDFFQKGHVYSIASNVAEQTKRNLSSSNAPDSVKNILLPILEDYVARLKADDLASSNIKDSSFDIYAKYSKNPYKYVVEMQASEVNQASGIASAPLTNALRRYFNPQKVVEIDKFFRERAESDSFIQGLITTKGSPSFVELATNELISTITGKPRKSDSYTVPYSKLDTAKVKLDASAVRADIKNKIKEAQNHIDAIKKASNIANSLTLQNNSSRVNLSSLLVLINSNLQSVISANMGDGNDKKVLNYRSGRFAASAKVERLSESRQGMISAFYSYMKNPYATFSEGGAQGRPVSRDPKLLISKSIREIAATKVANQLRAISV